MEGWGETFCVKNGASLGGYGAVAMNAALAASMIKLPEQLRKSQTGSIALDGPAGAGGERSARPR